MTTDNGVWVGEAEEGGEGPAPLPRRETRKAEGKRVPESEVLDLELGLDHAGGPQPHS